MESRVEPFTHDETFLQLHIDLRLLQRRKQDESDECVKADNFTPDGHESRLHCVGEVVLADELHVGPSVEASREEGGFPETLSVVETVNDSVVLLPLVGVHLLF